MKRYEKPLKIKNYGSIPHLPNSRLGVGDHHIELGQAIIATEKRRDKHDTIIVQEKLDGSNVGVLHLNGELIALTRNGFRCIDSPYLVHQTFYNYVEQNRQMFYALLNEGERVVGEWLYQAVGTIYELQHEPFVMFDMINGKEKQPFEYVESWSRQLGITMPKLLHIGDSLSVDKALELLGEFGHHGATETCEGLIYRVERNNKFDFLCKFVREDKQDGKYMALEPPILNKLAQVKSKV